MAGVRGAFIHLLLAITSSISNLAVAVVNVSSIQTLARVTAQIGDSNTYRDRMRQSALELFFNHTSTFLKTPVHSVYLSVWLPPHRRHLARHNKGPSSRSDIRICRRCPAASKFPHSYRVMSRTNAPSSEGLTHI